MSVSALLLHACRSFAPFRLRFQPVINHANQSLQSSQVDAVFFVVFYCMYAQCCRSRDVSNQDTVMYFFYITVGCLGPLATRLCMHAVRILCWSRSILVSPNQAKMEPSFRMADICTRSRPVSHGLISRTVANPENVFLIVLISTIDRLGRFFGDDEQHFNATSAVGRCNVGRAILDVAPKKSYHLAFPTGSTYLARQAVALAFFGQGPRSAEPNRESLCS